MTTPVEDMSETQLILLLALTLFDMPRHTPEMTDEDALSCGIAAHELLTQYLRKLSTGSPPELTPETQKLLAKVRGKEFCPRAH